MNWRAVVTMVVLVIFGVGFIVLPGTRGGLGYFSPYTLEYKVQSEFAILGGHYPIYRSVLQNVDNELLTFIQREGFVTPITPKVQRWETMFHWNEAWRDGYAPLDKVFRYRGSVMEWSKADPERAKLFWSEGFTLLRSDKEGEIEAGREILSRCWRCKSIQELQEEIAAIKAQIPELEEIMR